MVLNLVVPAVTAVGVGLLNRLFAPTTYTTIRKEAQRLDNLGAPESSYGYLIRDIFGRNRIDGCSLFWAKPLREEIIEDSQTIRQGGKGGGGNITTTITETAKYYMTAAFLIGGEIANDGIQRVWANGVQIYAKGDTGPTSQAFLEKTQIRYGTATQNPSELIESVEGTGNVPALRGRSFIAFNDYPIELFKGSGYPSIDVEANGLYSNGGTTQVKIKDIIWHICLKAGIAQADVIFLNDCGELAFQGMIYENGGQGYADFIQDILTHFQLIVKEEGNKLYFDRLIQGSLTSAIPVNSLGARSYNTELQLPYEKPLVDYLELPSKITIEFVNQQKDFQRGSIFFQDSSASHINEKSFSSSIVSNDTDMGRAASRLLFLSKTQAQGLEKLYLLPAYNGIMVGDYIAIEEDESNRVYQVSNKTIADNYLIELTCNGVLGTLYGDGEVGQPGEPPDIEIVYPEPSGPRPVGTATLIVLDIPLIRDSDPDGTIYFAVLGDENWLGGTIYVSRDAGASYSPLTNAAGSSKTGLVDLATPDVTGLDETTIITVQTDAILSSVTQAKFDQNEGLLFKLGDELIMARDADLIAPSTYELSYLRRGVRGTEWATEGHGTNETFVLLSGYLAKAVLSPSDLGQTLRFKVVGTGDSEPLVLDYVSHVYIGANLEPYAPVLVEGTYDQGGNITLTWTRRDRHAGSRTDYSAFPLSEVFESYEIEIFDGITIERTLSSSTQTVYYSAQQQIEDFGSVQTTLDVGIYQVSALTGRGYASTNSLVLTLASVLPTITDFSPRTAGIGDTITIYGSGFTGATSVSINGTPGNNLVVTSDSLVTIEVAPGTTSGIIEVITPSGTATGLVGLVVDESGDLDLDIELIRFLL